MNCLSCRFEAITNFYVMYADKVDPGQDNGKYGKGTAKVRYTAMLDVLQANESSVDRNAAWEEKYNFWRSYGIYR